MLFCRNQKNKNKKIRNFAGDNFYSKAEAAVFRRGRNLAGPERSLPGNTPPPPSPFSGTSRLAALPTVSFLAFPFVLFFPFHLENKTRERAWDLNLGRKGAHVTDSDQSPKGPALRGDPRVWGFLSTRPLALSN